jgi:thiamine-phosphate pyrophosphorylase
MTYKTRFAYLLRQSEAIAQGAAQANPHLHALPALFFFTDPARITHPEDIVRLLPPGCGIVFRHFGDPHAIQRARLLKSLADQGGLTLLIGEDVELALEIGAHGVHLAERSLGRAAEIRKAYPDLLLTGARHHLESVGHADEDGLDGLFISPVFRSLSPSAEGVAPLNLMGVRHFVDRSRLPLFGLGGINADNITSLIGSGLNGVAAIDAFVLDAG